MLNPLEKRQKLNEFIFLAVLSLFCFCFSLTRVFYAKSFHYLFLNWNLFLAFIPWLFSDLLLRYPNLHRKKLLVLILLFFWLLFFPNAPYILTDLFHLRKHSRMPNWFDLLLVLSFAWTGLLFGFISLWNIERLINGMINRKLVLLISSVLLFVGSFGVYLGRYLRWNSWDIIHQPVPLIYDISDRVTNPLKHPGAWGMTLLMGIFLNMVYWSFRLVRQKTPNQ